MPRHDCAQTRLRPGTLVPQHELLLLDTIMSLVNNNIIIVFTRLIMCQLDWWKHKHAQLVVGEAKCDYLTSVQQSPTVFLLEYFVILLCQGTKYVSGHKRVWAQTYTFLPRHDCDHTIITCQGTNVSGHKHVWAQTCVGTNVCGHKRVWAQTCLGTNVCGHNRVWAQTCLGTIMSGHNRVWAQTCLGTIVWAQVCMGRIVWSPFLCWLLFQRNLFLFLRCFNIWN